MPLRVHARIRAHERPHGGHPVLETDIRQRHADVVGRTEIERHMAQRPLRPGIAEPDAETDVVLYEVAERGVERKHAAFHVDAVEYQHQVRFVARQRTVGGRESYRHLALVGIAYIVYPPVDTPGGRQEPPVGRHGSTQRIAGGNPAQTADRTHAAAAQGGLPLRSQRRNGGAYCGGSHPCKASHSSHSFSVFKDKTPFPGRWRAD